MATKSKFKSDVSEAIHASATMLHKVGAINKTTMLDFDAGKYAAFVWPAFGVSALFLGAMIADSLARARRWKRQVEALTKAQTKERS